MSVPLPASPFAGAGRAQTAITIVLGEFALHAPFHHLRPAVFGLVEKDVLRAVMTIIVGVDLGFPSGFSF